MLPDTSLGLLERLTHASFDEAAWGEFVERYGTTLVDWARRWGAQGSDAHDLAQEVMLTLVRQMRDFHYDPSQSFRGWLKTVAYRTLVRQRSRGRRCLAPFDDRFVPLTDAIAAEEDLFAVLVQKAEQDLVDVASERVRLRVKSKTWQAFEMATLLGMSGEEVAGRLGMPLASVYVARHNVVKMLREEVGRLGGR
jgi:RNA polymerase sigma factor (sigma-70 family)